MDLFSLLLVLVLIGVVLSFFPMDPTISRVIQVVVVVMLIVFLFHFIGYPRGPILGCPH